MSIDKKIKYKDIKGQKHMLAYITPGEAKTLEKLGGQKTITPEGIPAYPPGMGDPNYGGNGGSKGDNDGNGGSDRDHSRFDVGSGYYGETPTTTAPDTRENDGPSGFNIHGGPTYQTPTINPVDEVALTGFGTVPGVDYSAVGPNSQFAKNTALNNQLLNTPYQGFNTPFISLNILGNTLGKFGYDKNTKFFVDNSIGGKINPETGKPFGYGIDGYKDYMRQRTLGNVGAYGGTELSQNAINARSGGDNGIMDVYNDPNDPDDGDSDGDGDVDQDDFIFRYFDKTGETLQTGAGGVQDLMTQIRKRISDIFS